MEQDLSLSFDPGGGPILRDLVNDVSLDLSAGVTLCDQLTGCCIDLSTEELTWLTTTIAATSALPSLPTSVDDALDAHDEDGGNCIPLSEK